MAVTRSQNVLMLEVATQIPVLLGCLLLFGGWSLARIFAFPLAFLVFSLPPPGWVMDAFTVPLKALDLRYRHELFVRSRLPDRAERGHDHDRTV